MPVVKEMMNPNVGMEKVPPYTTWGNAMRPPSATYLLTGPTSGAVSVASTDFTVSLKQNTSNVQDVVITPSDGEGGGAFSKASVILNDLQPSATFTYTPDAVAEEKTISVTNNRGLTDPSSIAYTTSE